VRRLVPLAATFQLIQSTQDRWRTDSAPHIIALVCAGATLINGNLVEQAGEGAESATAKRSSSTGLDNCSPTFS
jgi:hypothetical protein